MQQYNMRCQDKVQIRHQTTGTKNKCIDRVYIKVIDVEVEIEWTKWIDPKQVSDHASKAR